jgi:hypothetical protein
MCNIILDLDGVGGLDRRHTLVGWGRCVALRCVSTCKTIIIWRRYRNNGNGNDGHNDGIKLSVGNRNRNPKQE